MAISPMITARSWMLALALVAGASGFAIADDSARKQAQSQVEFGIAVAQRGLWQEAVFRWERDKHLLLRQDADDQVGGRRDRRADQRDVVPTRDQGGPELIGRPLPQLELDRRRFAPPEADQGRDEGMEGNARGEADRQFSDYQLNL